MKRQIITKKTKGGYPLNKNGMPLNLIGVNPLNSRTESNHKIHQTYTKVGRYKPTIHNISII